MNRITALDVVDVRFPTSRQLDGSDAMNPEPDYSAAYVTLRVDDADRRVLVAVHDRAGHDAEVVRGLDVGDHLFSPGSEVPTAVTVASFSYWPISAVPVAVQGISAPTANVSCGQVIGSLWCRRGGGARTPAFVGKARDGATPTDPESKPVSRSKPMVRSSLCRPIDRRSSGRRLNSPRVRALGWSRAVPQAGGAGTSWRRGRRGRRRRGRSSPPRTPASGRR